MLRSVVAMSVGVASVLVFASVPSKTQAKATNLGTWKLNLAKSKHSLGNPPKSLTRTWEDRGDGVLLFTTEGINAQGTPTKGAFAFKYDGRDYPLAQINVPRIQMIAQRRIDAYTAELTFKADGKVTSTATETVSKDGSTMTFDQRGTNAQGQAYHNVQILEKQ